MMLERIRWSKTFETGVRSIDLQHQELVGMLNDLVEANEAGDSSAIPRLMQKLASYVIFHFSTEESLIAGNAACVSHRAEHYGEHRVFAKKITEWVEMPVPQLIESITAIIDYLTDWLVQHIQGTDKTLAKILIQQGKA